MISEQQQDHRMQSSSSMEPAKELEGDTDAGKAVADQAKQQRCSQQSCDGYKGIELEENPSAPHQQSDPSAADRKAGRGRNVRQQPQEEQLEAGSSVQLQRVVELPVARYSDGSLVPASCGRMSWCQGGKSESLLASCSVKVQEGQGRGPRHLHASAPSTAAKPQAFTAWLQQTSSQAAEARKLRRVSDSFAAQAVSVSPVKQEGFGYSTQQLDLATATSSSGSIAFAESGEQLRSSASSGSSCGDPERMLVSPAPGMDSPCSMAVDSSAAVVGVGSGALGGEACLRPRGMCQALMQLAQSMTGVLSSSLVPTWHGAAAETISGRDSAVQQQGMPGLHDMAGEKQGRTPLELSEQSMDAAAPSQADMRDLDVMESSARPSITASSSLLCEQLQQQQQQQEQQEEVPQQPQKQHSRGSMHSCNSLGTLNPQEWQHSRTVVLSPEVMRMGGVVKQSFTAACFPRYDEEIVSPYSAAAVGDEAEAELGLQTGSGGQEIAASREGLLSSGDELQAAASHGGQLETPGTCLQDATMTEGVGTESIILQREQQQCLQALLFDSIDFSSAAACALHDGSTNNLDAWEAVSREQERSCQYSADAATDALATYDAACPPAAAEDALAAAAAPPSAAAAAADCSTAAGITPGSLGSIAGSSARQAVQQDKPPLKSGPFAACRSTLEPAAAVVGLVRGVSPEAAAARAASSIFQQVLPTNAVSSKGRARGQQMQQLLDRPAWGAAVPGRAKRTAAESGRGVRPASRTRSISPGARVGSKASVALAPVAARRASTGTWGVAQLGGQISSAAQPIVKALATIGAAGTAVDRRRSMTMAAAAPILARKTAGAAGGRLMTQRDRVPRAKSACDMQKGTQVVAAAAAAGIGLRRGRDPAARCRSVDVSESGSADAKGRPAMEGLLQEGHQHQQIRQQRQLAGYSSLSFKPAAGSQGDVSILRSPIRSTWAAPRMQAARARRDNSTATAAAAGKAAVGWQRSMATGACGPSTAASLGVSKELQHHNVASAAVARKGSKQAIGSRAEAGATGDSVFRSSVRLEKTEGQLRLVPAESDR